jgi:hypothetical protein
MYCLRKLDRILIFSGGYVSGRVRSLLLWQRFQPLYQLVTETGDVLGLCALPGYGFDRESLAETRSGGINT